MNGRQPMVDGRWTADNALPGAGSLAWAVSRGSWWGRWCRCVRWGGPCHVAGLGLGERPAGGLLEVVVVAADGILPTFRCREHSRSPLCGAVRGMTSPNAAMAMEYCLSHLRVHAAQVCIGLVCQGRSRQNGACERQTVDLVNHIAGGR